MFIRKPLISVLALSLVACGNTPTGPSQHDPARYGTVRVGVSAQLSDPNRLIEQSLTKIDALGPDFVQVSAGNSSSITIEPEPNPQTIGDLPCEPVVSYRVDTKTIYIDQRCLLTSMNYHDAIIAGISQLIARIVGMRTICRIDQMDANCSEVGRGPSMMNNGHTANLPTTGMFYLVFSLLNQPVTDLDLAEYRLHGHPL